MTAPTLAIEFARGGNSDAFAREGFYPSEAQHRWTRGVRSVLALPPLPAARAYVLTLDAWPFAPEGVTQTLALDVNGVEVAASLSPRHGAPLLVSAPGDLFSDAHENLLVWRHPNAASPANHGASHDARALAFAWRRLGLVADDAALFARPELLAEDSAGAPAPADVAAAFQSLGQNCEFGLFQRRCGAEPHGLLRFAFISPEKLAQGLRTRFAGVEDASLLSFQCHPGADIDGVHAVYGLYYHTHRRDGDVELADFRIKQARRLGFLAQMLIEQIETDEKIFLRSGGFDSDGEAVALHRLLRAYHPQARLFVVQEAKDTRLAGRVERIAPNLYRGYLSKFADPARVQTTLPFADWLRLCNAVYAHQRDIGRRSAGG